MEDKKTQSGEWQCNYCRETEGVQNGLCPTCGPSQTTPVNEVAKKEAGYYEAEEEKKQKAEAEAKEDESTPKE